MLRLTLSVFLLAFSVGCAHHDASVQNSDTQKQWPGSNQSVRSQESTSTETGPNTPAGQAGNHVDKITKPSEYVPSPEGKPGDFGQGNNKNPETQGTTSGPNPEKH